MTQVPDEPEVVLPDRRRDLRADHLSKMVHEPEIVDREELTAHHDVEAVVEEPEIVLAEHEE